MDGAAMNIAKLRARRAELLSEIDRVDASIATSLAKRAARRIESKKALRIINLYCRIARITPDAIYSKRRSRRTTAARHRAMYLIHHYTSLNAVEIAAIFNRDHSSVLYGIGKVRDEKVIKRYAKDTRSKRAAA